MVAPLIFRADASVAMGTGHVMRCLALAQAWHDAGGTCVFAMAETTAAAEERIRAEGFAIVRLDSTSGGVWDTPQLAKLALTRGAAWVVVDGYHFDAEYQHYLKQAGVQLLCIDDNGDLAHYYADLVLNQNFYAREDSYRNREPDTQLLLGPPYIMLRNEFLHWREWKREIPPIAHKVLVTMGGSDPDNVTERVIRSLFLLKNEELQVAVVAGGSNPNFESLKSLVTRFKGAVRLYRDVRNITELMAWADLAVIAAGGTLWELLYMGCSVLSYARNPIQASIISNLYQDGIVQDLGDPKNFDAEALASAIEELALSPRCRDLKLLLGRNTIDGMGASRVCERLINQLVR